MLPLPDVVREPYHPSLGWPVTPPFTVQNMRNKEARTLLGAIGLTTRSNEPLWYGATLRISCLSTNLKLMNNNNNVLRRRTR